jgi:hypothetical protein
MLHNHTLALLMMQQMAMPQFLFSPFIQMPPLAEVTHTPFGPIQMPQQSLVALSTPRRAYLKRKRETPTPKRLAAATTPAQAAAAGEPTEAYPEVNFNDHSAYKRLLSSVWDFKGDPPWSRYSVQQVPPPARRHTSSSRRRLQLIDIVKTPSSWAPEWDGQVGWCRCSKALFCDLFFTPFRPVCCTSLTSARRYFTQDMDGVITRFDWNALKFASSRKRDILYEYVKRAVRGSTLPSLYFCNIWSGALLVGRRSCSRWFVQELSRCVRQPQGANARGVQEPRPFAADAP